MQVYSNQTVSQRRGSGTQVHKSQHQLNRAARSAIKAIEPAFQCITNRRRAHPHNILHLDATSTARELEPSRPRARVSDAANREAPRRGNTVGVGSLGCSLNSAEAREGEARGVHRGIGARRLVDATDAACRVLGQRDQSGHTRRDQRSRAAPFKERLPSDRQSTWEMEWALLTARQNGRPLSDTHLCAV